VFSEGGRAVVEKLKPRECVAPLVQFAQQAGLMVEASPNGSWIRFPGQRGTLYVVQDTWGDGCTLMELGGEGRKMQHFIDPQKAVAAAIQQARIRAGVASQLGSVRVKAG
jgi:hypothetical protein